MHDTDGLAVDIVAPAGGLVAGQFFYDEVTGWAGSVLDTVDEGEGVSLEIARGHRYEVSDTLSVEVGDVLHVGDDGTLTNVATTPARPYMKVYEVVPDVTADTDLVAGVLLPQTWEKFAVETS